jgi:hypothetical protein
MANATKITRTSSNQGGEFEQVAGAIVRAASPSSADDGEVFDEPRGTSPHAQPASATMPPRVVTNNAYKSDAGGFVGITNRLNSTGVDDDYLTIGGPAPATTVLDAKSQTWSTSL